MSERRVGEQALDPVDKATETVEALQSSLSGWYSSRDSDSMMAQRVRASSYYEDGEILRQLINELTLRGSHQLVLRVEEVVRSVSFMKGAYDSINVTHHEIEPGTTLKLKGHTIKSAEDLFLNESGRTPPQFYHPGDLYVGDFRQYVSLDFLAKTLHEGSLLELTEAETTEEPATTPSAD